MVAALKLAPLPNSLSEKSRLGQKAVVRRMRRRRSNVSRGRRWRNQKRSAEVSYGRVYYNYFRTYDPTTGRYLESDPIGLGGGLNTFGYVGGSPLSYIDPLGLDMTTREWQEFLNSLNLPTVSEKNSLPARSQELRALNKAIASNLPITLARQAAREGSGDACEILTTEAAVIGAVFGLGEAGVLLAEAGLSTPSLATTGRAVCLALGLCRLDVDSAAQGSRAVLNPTIRVVNDLTRRRQLREAADAAQRVTTHLPK